MRRRSIHHLHTRNRRPKESTRWRRDTSAGRQQPRSRTNGRGRRFALHLGRRTRRELFGMRRHAGHRQHRRWNRDHWRVQCCKRRGRRSHQRVGGHRVLRQHTMGGGRGSGRRGSLVRMVKWRQGDTGHKDRWRGPRFGNVHKALTSDKLLDTTMPPTATKGIQARISCPVVHASTDRTDPVSWRRGPYKRRRRGGSMGLGFRVGTNVFLLGW